MQVWGALEDEPFTVVIVEVHTPLARFSVEMPPKYQNRLDIGVSLRRPIDELEGSVEGLIGHTVRKAHPSGAKDMAEVIQSLPSVSSPSQTHFHIRLLVPV